MKPGDARKGMVVYTRHKIPGEEVWRIVRADVANVVYPGTTNEFYQVFFTGLDGSIMLERKPSECEEDRDRARNQLILEVHAQMDKLNQQLISLGVHTHAPSHWKGR